MEPDRSRGGPDGRSWRNNPLVAAVAVVGILFGIVYFVRNRPPAAPKNQLCPLICDSCQKVTREVRTTPPPYKCAACGKDTVWLAFMCLDCGKPFPFKKTVGPASTGPTGTAGGAAGDPKAPPAPVGMSSPMCPNCKSCNVGSIDNPPAP